MAIFFSSRAEGVRLSLCMLRAVSVQMHNLERKKVRVPCSGEPPHSFLWVTQIAKSCRKGLVKIREISLEITGLYCIYF